MRISDFQELITGEKLPQEILKLTLKHLLLALDFLHSECDIAHTDIQAKNILMRIEDETVLSEFEEAEIQDPSPRKIDGKRTIYTSRQLRIRGSVGRPVLCDFGEARVGDKKFTEDIQPFLYRAPEVLLRKPWGKKVDIWNLGVLGKLLFDGRDINDETTNEVHFAEMIALLGSPPQGVLDGSPIIREFFDNNGNWIDETKVPSKSLEEMEENLTGRDQVAFLEFMRKMLRWVPEDRMSAFDLLDDPWLNS
ncbi:Protein kinase-like (PK-like) [Glarea lozoyensis ATCC 20868]|uniref:non-specific serine/threonine protein kinase n=1 Tax=Glarea lozoyensis (strain ATCC 20868 / MF5171) TaxID=1116229 RepID=S3DH45_GLAL2|nr:Protein kinase-like (PK-like) [Glarea lozoyensis ATCC 20868]EPE36474.1 Protein kinase-like (PK-like) [Glarea lozoyensis ATCC 20868]